MQVVHTTRPKNELIFSAPNATITIYLVDRFVYHVTPTEHVKVDKRKQSPKHKSTSYN